MSAALETSLIGGAGDKAASERSAPDRLTACEEKAVQRRSYLALRRATYPSEPVPWPVAPADWSFLPEEEPPAALLLYAATAGEMDTAPLAALALRDGVPLYYPRVTGREMRFLRVTALSELVPGAFGILEPPEGAQAYSAEQGGVCVVPGVCFDREGRRMGRGGGYYDRFLASFSGLSVGLCPAAFLAERVVTEPGDRPVALVMTPEA